MLLLLFFLNDLTGPEYKAAHTQEAQTPGKFLNLIVWPLGLIVRHLFYSYNLILLLKRQ